jgi:hypothetical protein
VEDPDGYFGERVAAGYDDPSDPMFGLQAVDPAVGLLAELAGSGRALELAIGTGRIGLPLSLRGVPVHGIELSRAMAARLRAKPGGEAIAVTIGDMVTTRVEGIFTVAYLVFNTINNLTTQQAHVSYSFDQATQQYRGHYVEFADGTGQYLTIPFRYVWPAELDLMAQLAGLQLRDRWAGWSREPFTSDSRSHVSVWEKPAA